MRLIVLLSCCCLTACTSLQKQDLSYQEAQQLPALQKLKKTYSIQPSSRYTIPAVEPMSSDQPVAELIQPPGF